MPDFNDVLLHTDRLVLRPLAESDAAGLMGIYSVPEVARYLSGPAWTSMDQAHSRIARDREAMAAGTYLRLGVFRGERLVADCTLFDLSEQCRRAEIGYALAHDCWGQGLMNEALRALVACGFDQMNLNRIGADIDPRNLASARSLERLGFRKEGHLRERWIVGDEVSDTGYYGLLAKDWPPRPKVAKAEALAAPLDAAYTITSDPAAMDVMAIHAYLTRSYWAEGIPLATVRRAVENSLCIGAFHAGRQVGMVRVISDCATFGYVADVYVLEAHRGQGLARHMLDAMQAHPKLQGLRRLLLSTRDAHGLYAQVGFERVATPDRLMHVMNHDVYKPRRD